MGRVAITGEREPNGAKALKMVGSVD